MAYLYIDESIREHGGFIIGAAVVSKTDLSAIVAEEWVQLGLDPQSSEYKSSDPKENNELGSAQRRIIAELLHGSKLALAVLPASDRRRLGEYCVELVLQLHAQDLIAKEQHTCYLDQNIGLRQSDVDRLQSIDVLVKPGCDSKLIGGIQVADHAAHALGGMLLEEMGLISKRVPAGENSGYHPEEMIELGFELWASLRYALIGRNEYIEGYSPPREDPANPYFRVDGVGMYIAPTCSMELAQSARARFGVNYLGCIH